MKASTVLKRAKKLISKPERWARREYARKRSFSPANVHSSEAYRFCALGAVCRVTGVLEDYDAILGTPAGALLDMAARKYKVDTHGKLVRPDDVNDYRDHRTVLRMFDSAIRLAERNEAKGRRR